MRITINSIEADIRDTSTFTESSFLIVGYIIQYEIDIEKEHSVRGTFKWHGLPNEHKIVKFLKWFYAKRNTNIPEPTGEAEGTENTD
jgi:hypothetical protein